MFGTIWESFSGQRPLASNFVVPPLRLSAKAVRTFRRDRTHSVPDFATNARGTPPSLRRPHADRVPRGRQGETARCVLYGRGNSSGCDGDDCVLGGGFVGG